jgi:hypothetical protein
MRPTLKQRGGFRNLNRVGRTRIRLAALLTKLAQKKWGPEYECWPEDLSRNNPAYVTFAQDGVSWDGRIRKWGDLYKGASVFSWSSMGAILKAEGQILCDDGEVICGKL